MLEASGALVYVNEPLNPQYPPGRSPGVLRALKYTAGFGPRRLRGRRALLDDPAAAGPEQPERHDNQGQPRASSVLLNSPIRPSTPGQS
jgi:hypothetical protein